MISNVSTMENELINSQIETPNIRGKVLSQIDLLDEYMASEKYSKAKTVIQNLINTNEGFEDMDECLAYAKLQYMYIEVSDEYVEDVFKHLRNCQVKISTLESLFYNDFICIEFYKRRTRYREALQLLGCMVKQIKEIQDEGFYKDEFLSVCYEEIDKINKEQIS